MKIFGVRFRSSLKILYYDMGSVDVTRGTSVICNTKNGLEFGKICCVKDVDEIVYGKLGNCRDGFVRIATKQDEDLNNQNVEFEKNAAETAKICVKRHKLDMKLVLVVRLFDRTKLMFFFTATNRIDFRRLVRNLAAIFKTRVELRQIGIRDEAKILSGIGICGREFCCSNYLNDFNHVSIKMAKVQNLSLNPRKISGCCGRLMCCLQHEQLAYVSLNRESPGVGDRVMTPVGEGIVVSRNLLLGEFKVKPDSVVSGAVKVFNLKHIKKLS